MSIRILLENFLGLMKEDGELNQFLPVLLSGMGHKIIFYPDKGVREFGVDLVSVGKDHVDGKEKLFMWLIKCGNINRSAWNTQDQSVRQSIDEVEDVFLSTHVLPQHMSMPKKLVILTNGEYHSNVRMTLSQYLSKWERRTGCNSEVVGGSVLASWAEQYLLDENILPPSQQVLFRRVLANVTNPELCVPVGRKLIRALFSTFNAHQKSVRLQLKVRLTSLRATRTALTVIFHWAETEGNLESARQLSEFAILEAWVVLQPVMKDDSTGNDELVSEFNALLLHYLTVGAAYSNKIEPYWAVTNSLSLISGDALVTADLAFREIGQLGMQGAIWAFLYAKGGNSWRAAIETASSAGLKIIAILNSHSCTMSPAFDYHALDIHTALICLMETQRQEVAETWLIQIVTRLDLISQVESNMRFWPMQADFADALEARHDSEYQLQEFLNTSILLPIILLWCATLGLTSVYQRIRNNILPRIKEVTMNMWFCDENFDSIVSSPSALQESGFSFTLSNLPPDIDGFIELARKSSHEVPSLESSQWHKAGCPFIPLLAARHWRLQIPKQMLVEHILGFSAPRSH